MSNQTILLPDQANLHPSFIFDEPLSESERAQKLKQLLLTLSKQKENKDFSSILRHAADSIREKAFGYNRAVTRKKILRLLEEFQICEIDDFLDELKLPEKEIRAALNDLIGEDKITVGRRRRWQEAGKHYNLIYEIKG